MRAQLKVIELLRTLRDVQEEWNPGSAGDGVRLMPSDYSQHSYPELERRLRQLQEENRQQWWHVSMRYRWGDPEKRLIVTSRKTRQGRIPLLPPRTELLIQGETLEKGLMWVKCYEWSEQVDPIIVTAGVDRLTEMMYGGQWWKLTLPKPILERLEVDNVRSQQSYLPSHPLPA